MAKPSTWPIQWFNSSLVSTYTSFVVFNSSLKVKKKRFISGVKKAIMEFEF